MLHEELIGFKRIARMDTCVIIVAMVFWIWQTIVTNFACDLTVPGNCVRHLV